MISLDYFYYCFCQVYYWHCPFLFLISLSPSQSQTSVTPWKMPCPSLSLSASVTSVLELRLSTLRLLKCSISSGNVASPLPWMMVPSYAFLAFRTHLLLPHPHLPIQKRDRVYLVLTFHHGSFRIKHGILCYFYQCQ